MSQSSSSAQQNYKDIRVRQGVVEEKEKAHLATSNASTKRVLANADLLIDIRVRKVVFTAGHRTDKDGDVVRRREGWEVF